MNRIKRVPARYFVTLADALQKQGMDIARMLRMAAIDETQFRRADARLAPEQIDALIGAAGRLAGRADLGFEAGLLIKMTSHDILGYGMLGCRDFDQVLHLVSRYYHLMNELFTLRYRRTPTFGEALYSPVSAMRQETLRFMTEALAVAHHNQLRLLLGPALGPFDIVLGMPRPPHHARYDALAPARVRFDEGAMPGVRVLMGAVLLDHPLPLASQAVVRQVSERLEALSRRPAPGAAGWSTFITMMLTEAHGELLTLDDIGRRLNVSARTIDRNLEKEGARFRDIAQRVYMGRARELLLQPGMTVTQVSERLGFSDAANFSRAFRRYTGCTPSRYQQTAATPPRTPG
ncbi:MAG TPA: AraC family transcriptional regulator ligand-binding domain-containing protein [Burkholderiaceae bacterium]|nr:AraC family transcriptional regulator ligand-binding domain-containing protein [Burkholderiaceae bacterium]